MDIEAKIRAIIEEYLPDESLFIASIKITGAGQQKKVTILLDGDNGVSIETCALISRKVGFFVEENEIIEDAYRLEVSSFGLGQPLQLERQYVSNIGRTLEVKFPDGSKKEGELIKVEKDFFQLNEEIREGKKKPVFKMVAIPFAETKSVCIVPSFK